jgi:hypothetical protein
MSGSSRVRSALSSGWSSAATLELEGAVELGPEVGQRALVHLAARVVEVLLEELLVERLDVDVEAEVVPVQGHVGEVAARRRHPGGAEPVVGQALAHVRRILLRVVEGELVEAEDLLAGHVLVELHLERRLLLRQRAEEALLAQPDLPVLLAVDRQVGLEVGERALERLGQAVAAQDVEHRAGLAAQRVPVGAGHLDLDLEQVVGVEQGAVVDRAAGVGAGIRLVPTSAFIVTRAGGGGGQGRGDGNGDSPHPERHGQESCTGRARASARHRVLPAWDYSTTAFS